ncbi:MAG: ABC transporter permease [Gemmatimonadaceae bacterium]
MTSRGIRPGVRRLFNLTPRSDGEAHADADAELEAFLDERVEHLVRRGMTYEAARAEALARLGAPVDAARVALRRSAARREERRRLRDVAGDLRDDLRFAWRQCVKAPAFTSIAVITLALSIGANTAIFSVVHRLLLAPLPYPNGDRIVMPVLEEDGAFRKSIGPELTRAWLSRTRTITGVAGASVYLFSVRPDGSVDTISTAAITANLLPALGVRPVLGRGFASRDERDDEDHYAVAMISHALWQRSYGGRPDVLGRTVSYGGRPLVIVGVTPPGQSLPLWRTPPPDLWVPGTLDLIGQGGNGAMERGPSLFASLRPGSSAEAASRELQTIAATMPDSLGGRTRVRAFRARDFLSARERRAVQVLFAAVGALLLIACANLANLLLSRAWARQREFAVRGALGAGRARIARQVLTESVALALVGGLVGVGVAWIVLRVIIALRPPTLEHLVDVRLDPSVLLWCLGVSVITGIVFGAAPALLAGTQAAGDVLRRETRGGSQGLASRRVRSALVVLEVAASIVLLVGAGLLVRSFVALERMPLGYEPRGLVYTDVLMGGRQFREQRVEMRDAIVQRLRALPGVTGVAIGVMPGRGYRNLDGLDAQTDREAQTTHVPMLGTVFITPDYFRVARIALLGGRLPDSLAPASAQGGPLGLSPEVLVNREFARRIWPHGGAIGGRVRAAGGAPGGRAEPWSTVVGIVEDTRMPEVHGDVAALQVYSLIPSRLGAVPFIVRTAASGDVTAPLIKRTIASVHPALWVRPTLSGDTYLRNGLAPTRFAMALLTAFAAVALLLAAVGIYGIVAYGVTQRTREIGVRMALGAESGSVIRLVLGGSMRLAAAGAILGLLAAVAITRVLRSMLYGVGVADPLTFAAVALLVTVVTLVASYVPARRALQVDPAEALRAD